MNIFQRFWNWITGNNKNDSTPYNDILSVPRSEFDDRLSSPPVYGDRRPSDSSTGTPSSSQSSLINEYKQVQNSGINKFFGSLTDLIPALVNRITAGELTGAEREQNAFNAQQAEIDRQFQADMANTQYQRGVADMRAAGVNPAVAIGNGGAAAPSGSAASGSGSGAYLEGMSALMSMMMMKPQIELMRKQGDAALENAAANKISAQAAVDNAETNRGRLSLDKLLGWNTIELGRNTIRLTDANIMAINQDIKESESRITLQGAEYLSKMLDYEFDKQTFDDRKDIVVQELLYKAVSVSNMRGLTAYYSALTENAHKEGKLLDAAEVSAKLSSEWRENNPGLAKGLEIAGIGSDIIGNLLHFNIGFGRSKSESSVNVRSNSTSVSDVYTHKRP